MDHKVGQILDTLDKLGIRDNTLIVFLSDNGGAFEANIGPYKGGKTDLHEGGIRVPGIISWPARLPRKRVTSILGHHCDVLPTLCAAAEIQTPPGYQSDGVNLLPSLLDGQPPKDRGTLLWQLDLMPKLQRHYPKPRPYATEVARQGKWKLLLSGGNPLALFDLAADPLEDYDVLAKYPEIVRELTGEARAFLAAPRDRRGAAAGTTEASK